MSAAFPLCQSGVVFPAAMSSYKEAAVVAMKDVLATRGEDVMISREGDDFLFDIEGLRFQLTVWGERARLVVSRPEEATPRTEAEAQAYLAALTVVLVRLLKAETVLWLRKDVVLTAAKFLEAADPVRPRRVKARAKSARPARALAWEGQFEAPQDAALTQILRASEGLEESVEAISLPIRIAAILLTVFVALFSLPMAVSLFIWNLLKGADLRASAAMLTMAALMVVLGGANTADLAFAAVMTPAQFGF